MNNRKLRRTALAAIAVLLTATSASAADVATEVPAKASSPVSEWTLSVAPYFWGAGLQGDVGLFGREPVDLDMSFGDTFDNLRFGGMITVELHNGTWGVVGDLIYVNTETDETITRTVGRIPVTLSASVETSSLAATLMGEFRAFSGDSAPLTSWRVPASGA